MADRKIDKALYGPSTLEVALGAVLGLLVGVLFACVYLVIKPVEAVKEIPKEPQKGVVYYVSGRADSARARGWQAKQQTFVQGGTIVANEDELNFWAASLNADTVASARSNFISTSGLNFRLDGERLQIAEKVLLNYFGLTKEVMVVANGSFVRAGDVFAFRPRTIYLGSCPLHAIPGAGPAFARLLTRRQKVSDDFRAAWAKLAAISVEERQLVATTQP
jgi:hypothetical protein